MRVENNKIKGIKTTETLLWNNTMGGMAVVQHKHLLGARVTQLIWIPKPMSFSVPKVPHIVGGGTSTILQHTPR